MIWMKQGHGMFQAQRPRLLKKIVREYKLTARDIILAVSKKISYLKSVGRTEEQIEIEVGRWLEEKGFGKHDDEA